MTSVDCSILTFLETSTRKKRGTCMCDRCSRPLNVVFQFRNPVFKVLLNSNTRWGTRVDLVVYAVRYQQGGLVFKLSVKRNIGYATWAQTLGQENSKIAEISTHTSYSMNCVVETPLFQYRRVYYLRRNWQAVVIFCCYNEWWVLCFMWKRVVAFGIGIYVVAGSRYGCV